MKIKKQPKATVKASENVTTQSDFSAVETVLDRCNAYEDAKCYIQNAIKELSTIANDDPVAKDSIANLAVVILDLESNH